MLQTLKLNNKKRKTILILQRQKSGRIDSRIPFLDKINKLPWQQQQQNCRHICTAIFLRLYILRGRCAVQNIAFFQTFIFVALFLLFVVS
jgi:hypothetical protein